jgi:class 3 adenylate cyclase/tetratricopeptide (TPR) repeat protein
MTSTATVTILFTDVVGSVELRSRRGDESAHKLMEAHFELVRRQIEHHSGQEVKTLGDGFMVAFVSARGAVNCAVAVQQALADHNRNNPDEQVHVRIGLNTGEAIEKEGDLFGSAVDAASRIMSKAAAGQILVSESARSVIGSTQDIRLLDRGPFWLKGFPERWRLFEVLWREEEPSAVPAPPRMAERTPFVGREQERADLRRFLDRAKSGSGSLVMIGGEPGVGKTRITEELAAEADRHGFLTLTGHCYEMEGAPPYIPFIEILQTFIHLAEPEEFLEDLGEAAPEVAKLVPELRERLPDLPEPRKIPAEQERLYLFNKLSGFLGRQASKRPLLIIIEDLHWADESTLLLLQHIAQRLSEMPVLMVGTYRTTELDIARSLARALEELFRQRLAHDLPLKPLPETDVSAMLRGRSGQEPPSRLVETIYQETEGNPFFVEEVFKHLVEEEKLFDSEGQWHADLRVEETDVPRGVLLVIGRRLERVSEQCRRILARAAVIGRGVGFRLLNEVIELDEDTLFDAIEEAERAQLVSTVTRHGEDRITFAHEYIRQTLLNDLAAPRRRRLHLHVAEAMEQLYAGALDQNAADLAHHFYQAGGNPEKTIEYAILAAERATGQAAYEEAVAQYQRALQALEQQQPVDELRQCEVLLALGRVSGNASDPDCAQEAFSRVTEIAMKLPAPEQFVEAVLGLHRYKYLVGFQDKPFLDMMEEGLALLDEGDSPLRAALSGRLSSVLEYLHDERRFSLSEEAVAMARRIGDPRALYYALWGKTFVWNRPLPEKMIDAKEFAQLEQEIGAQEGVNWALLYLCHYHWEQGDMDAALADLAALQNIVAELAIPDTMSRVKFVESTYAQMVGNFDEAERLAFEGIALGQKVYKAGFTQQFNALMYIIRRMQGRLDEVEETWQLGTRQNPHILFRAIIAHLHLMLGREEQARKEYEGLAAHDFADVPRDVVMFHVLGDLSELAISFCDTRRAALIYDIWYPYADHLYMIGLGNGCCGATTHWLGMLAGTMQRWDDAAAHFENAIETNVRIGARPFLARSQHEYARMLIERNKSGDHDRARALLDEAIPTYRELGMPTFLENAEELMNGL